MKVVYGIFPSLAPAEAARTRLHERAERTHHEDEAVSAAIHQYDIRNEDLPRSGRFATRSAVVGGLLVFACVGLFLSLLMNGTFAGIGGPPTIIGSGPVDVFLVAAAAGLFGAVGAGIAGTAGNRAKLNRLADEIAMGRVLLTLEAPKERARTIMRTMSRCGALRTGSL